MTGPRRFRPPVALQADQARREPHARRGREQIDDREQPGESGRDDASVVEAAGEQCDSQRALARHRETHRGPQRLDRRATHVVRRVERLVDEAHQREQREHHVVEMRQEMRERAAGNVRRVVGIGRRHISEDEHEPHRDEEERADADRARRLERRHRAAHERQAQRMRRREEAESPSNPSPAGARSPCPVRAQADWARPAPLARHWLRLSESRKASSSAWLALSLGSQRVS